jgi:hypothetical protein
MYSPNSYGTVNSSTDINIPYGSCLLQSNATHRQGAPGPDNFGTVYPQCVPQMIYPPSVLGPENTKNVNNLDTFFFANKMKPEGYSGKSDFGNIDLQSDRPPEPYKNYYINLASKSLHVKPDLVFSIFFSDENINHLRTTVVQKVKEITMDSKIAGTDGVDIKTPNMDDFFYYMVNIFQNYKIHNGSICFVNAKNSDDYKSEIAKLNSNVLQEYVSKMISQINMYIYYYLDASQMPQQLSVPTYNAMKGSRELEYNTGFQSGNSIGVASYNQVGNII